MLHDFIISNRQHIIELAQERVRQRTASKELQGIAEHGVPRFLGQLADALALNDASDAPHAMQVDHVDISYTAALHGYELLKGGFTIAQVVHGYGDVCQIVTELAADKKAAISPDEFRVFNRCLDDAIAGAVTAYGDEREIELANEGTERLGVLVHEMRNLLNAATLSFEVIKRGLVGLTGSTGTLHSRSLADLRTLIDRSLTEVRFDAGMPWIERLSLAEFVERVRANVALQAEAHGVLFSVGVVDGSVAIEADRQLLSSALINLIQNAIKFSKPEGRVTLTTQVRQERVLLEVADQCGGLPAGKAEEMFRPFTRRSSNRSGLGLGLSIARNAVRANAGELRVRDLPGTGCVFTIDLPQPRPR